MTDTETPSPLPLSRFTVIELTVARAGPTCGRHLADWGANVIRIEPPSDGGAEGEDVTGARFGPDRLNLHRNKKSVTLNLKTEEGKAVLFEMVKTADVVLENMRSNVKYRLGVDYETLRKINPRIVYGSISGFGQTGPYKDRPGVDQIAQAMGGLMSITGLPGQGPVRVGIPIVDLTAGGFLAQAVLVALLEREVTGVGRWVHTSLLESMIAMLDFQASRYLMAGEVAKQAGNNHPLTAPTGLYPASDGQIVIAASGDAIWERFCKALDSETLYANQNYKTAPLRVQNREALNNDIAEITKHKTMQHWYDVLSEASVPAGPINTIDKVFADKQVQQLDIVLRGHSPRVGELKLVAQPNNIQGVKKTLRLPPPALGEHTVEVLRSLGHTDADIEALRTKKAI
jgi:crotonobetainyl-CoA:carnitine CoA-transferase CaiB-like acyl-CoA transferase